MDFKKKNLRQKVTALNENHRVNKYFYFVNKCSWLHKMAENIRLLSEIRQEKFNEEDFPTTTSEEQVY